jgi:putative nucleotidyltransferase with HDIG domain
MTFSSLATTLALSATAAILSAFPIRDRRGLVFRPAIVVYFVLLHIQPPAVAIPACLIGLGAGLLYIHLRRGGLGRAHPAGGLAQIALAALFVLLDPAARLSPTATYLLVVLLAAAIDTAIQLPRASDGGGPAKVGGRFLLRYLAVSPMYPLYLLSIRDGGPGAAVLAGTPLVVLAMVLAVRSKAVARYGKKVEEMSLQNRLAARLSRVESTDEYLHRLRGYLERESEGEAILLSRTETREGWIAWGSGSETTVDLSDLPDPLPKANLMVPARILDREGILLGLNDERTLMLFLDGDCARTAAGFSEDLRDGLVHLVEHSWPAMGHSLKSEEAFLAAAVMLARLADAKDDYTHGHSIRVAEISHLLGQRLGLSEEDLRTLRVGALLHDLGKIAIPTEILTKKGILTPREREIIEKHPEEGASTVGGLSGYERVVEIIRSHHERLNGVGYPDGLSGKDIPFLARIVAVADTFDAITSTRSYHAHSDSQTALDIIRVASGHQFDSRVVEALEDIVKKGAEKLAGI